MIMIARPTFLCFILAVAQAASSQSVPVQTGSPVYQGFHLPTKSGILNYSLTASERASIGYSGENQTTNSAAFSGNLAFITQSALYPTSLVYSGGYTPGTGTQPSIFFQSLSASQTISRGRSGLVVTDALSYLPQSSSVGLSGLPGLGDLGANPNPSTNLGLLSNATQISNATSASYSRRLTGSTSLSGQGSYSIQRFLGGSAGVESNAYTVGGGVTHRINALSNLSAQYGFTNYSYVGISNSSSSQSASVNYSRSLTRSLSISVGGGPQIIDASPLLGTSAMITYQVSGSLSYNHSSEHGYTATLAFSRASNGGQGVSYGGESETVTSSISRRVGRSLGVAGSFGYSKTTSLQGASNPSVDANSYVASGQANRAIARSLSAYASYSLQRQSYQGASQGISPLNGSVQTLGFGITYSPQSLHLGRQ